MSPAGRTAEAAPLSRAGAGRMLFGVCAGLGRRSGQDPALFRILFLLGSAIGGLGVAAYAIALAAMENPAADDPAPPRVGRRGQMLGIALLGGAIVTGLALDGTLIDPATLVGVSLLLGGVSLVWRRTGGTIPGLGGPGSGSGADSALSLGSLSHADSARIVRTLAGLALVLAGVLLFAGTGTDLSGAAAIAIAAGIVAAGAGLIFAPRLAATREALDEARRARIRAEEQEAMAARLHDSVLQTLALIQRQEGEGRAASLARRQERELRGWLYGEQTPGDLETLAASMSATAARIEDQHGVKVDLVQTRDLPLESGTEALVAAAGEAITNAAKHAGVDSVSTMVRIDGNSATVFVRDRGCGFDPSAPGGEGVGIEESIHKRLARFGGSASIESAPGVGTEVELTVPVKRAGA